MLAVSIEITKEQYEEYKNRPRELANELISPSIFIGYGVYSPYLDVDTKVNKYFLRYLEGDSCD